MSHGSFFTTQNCFVNAAGPCEPISLLFLLYRFTDSHKKNSIASYIERCTYIVCSADNMKVACLQSTITSPTLLPSSRSSIHPGSFLPCIHSRRHSHFVHQPTVQVRAQQAQQEKPEVAKFADSVGLPTEEGLFGFKPFPEVSDEPATIVTMHDIVCLVLSLRCIFVRYGSDAWL